MKTLMGTMVWGVLLFTLGCSTVYSGNRVNTSGEDSLVFVRPHIYSILGTRSIRDNIEFTYEKLTMLPNGSAKLQIGLRNRGNQHWWRSDGRNVHLSATAYFYDESVKAPNGSSALKDYFPSDWNAGRGFGPGVNKPPVYAGARQYIQVLLGETSHIEILCPVKNVQGYQVVFAEQ